MGCSHYGDSLKPERLEEFGKKAANLLFDIRVMLDNSTPVLLYQGMSGVAHATTLAMEMHRREIEVFQVYVRKPREDSHGGPVEFRMDSLKPRFFVFVDDFVEEGGTRCASFNKVYQRGIISNNEIAFCILGDGWSIGRFIDNQCTGYSDFKEHEFFRAKRLFTTGLSYDDVEYVLPRELKKFSWKQDKGSSLKKLIYRENG